MNFGAALVALSALGLNVHQSNTIFYEAFDEPPAQYHFGVCVDDPDAGLGYDEKPVMALLRKAAQNQPLFGGTGSDCNDGLDNDGDGWIDALDPDCASPTSKSERPPEIDAGSDAGDVDAGDSESGGGGCSTSDGDAPRALALAIGVALVALVRSRASRASA